MMTSKGEGYTLCSLLFHTTSNYKENLQRLLHHINRTKKDSLIVASEVCLTGFDYENIEKATSFALDATVALKKASKKKIIILTMLEKIDNVVFNVAKIFHNGEVVFSRSKARLFRLGNEHKYMSEGVDEEFKVVEVDGIKIALFICFELRFKELWKKAEGADVIATPSWWGKPRAKHLKAFTQTLAIMNQCYVVLSDAQNEECTGLSSIISPQGEVSFNGNKPCLEKKYSKKEIDVMRKYINIGRE